MLLMVTRLALPSPVKPALQIQSEAASLPAGACAFGVHGKHALSAVAPLAVENLPAPQSVQAAFPGPALYLPATQPAHVPPLGPLKKPALQMHAETVALPAGACEFSGHTTHELDPVSVWNFPASHRRHELAPVFSLYLPTSQPVHCTDLTVSLYDP